MGPGAVRLRCSAPPTTTCPSTSATAPPSCPNAASSIPPSPGAASARPQCPGSGPSSTRRMSAATRMRHPASRADLRGTFAGLTHHDVTEYIRKLGVTAIELLPIHAFVDDSYLVEKGLRNYWGYNTIGFFAPQPRYLAGPFVNEFKEMVSQFHHAGIEVILDVVYNHTAEGNELGPTLVLQGHRQRLVLPAGRRTGATTSTTPAPATRSTLSHQRVLQMVADSLRYWATRDACRRLPLRPRDHPRARALRLRRRRRLPRRLPAGSGPQSGQADRRALGFRARRISGRAVSRRDGRNGTTATAIRCAAYWKGDEGKLAEFATRLSASADLFNKRGRKPWASVNFVTAHDGFTLNDLVSYNDKHNEANGEDNRDGHSNNLSWNHGAEGPTDDPAIRSCGSARCATSSRRCCSRAARR